MTPVSFYIQRPIQDLLTQMTAKTFRLSRQENQLALRQKEMFSDRGYWCFVCIKKQKLGA